MSVDLDMQGFDYLQAFVVCGCLNFLNKMVLVFV